MFNLSSIIFLLFLITKTNCSLNISRIYGGTKTDIKNAKHQVSIQVQTTRKFHTCGGCFISNNLVLTAAHCFM